MHLVYPPNVCISIVFDFPWDDCNTQEKLKTIVRICFFFGRGGGGGRRSGGGRKVNKVHYSLCENDELPS